METPSSKLFYGDLEAYKAMRKSGMAASAALDRLRYVDKIKTAYQDWSIDQSPSGATMLYTNIDRDEEFREIGTWTVEVGRDEDRTIEDEECYGPEDVEAFWDDAWGFFNVDVTYKDKYGRTGSSSLGGIDAGDHWETAEYPLHQDQQIFATAIDYYQLHEEAKKEALGQPMPLSAHVDAVIARIPNVVPGRDVFYNVDGDEALISVQRAGDTTIFISISSEGKITQSKRFVEWMDGFETNL